MGRTRLLNGRDKDKENLGADNVVLNRASMAFAEIQNSDVLSLLDWMTLGRPRIFWPRFSLAYPSARLFTLMPTNVIRRMLSTPHNRPKYGSSKSKSLFLILGVELNVQ